MSLLWVERLLASVLYRGWQRSGSGATVSQHNSLTVRIQSRSAFTDVTERTEQVRLVASVEVRDQPGWITFSMDAEHA